MTIRATLLARGYFPKELPPSFYTDAFAAFASSKAGRNVLAGHRPRDGTECVPYTLAMPGGVNRELRIPSPIGYAHLVSIAAKSFGRLLKRAHKSSFSRSHPSFGVGGMRAIQPALRPPNLPRERAKARTSAAFVAKADISHFYPTLYTHAVGWAIDPKLRQRANWQKTALLGKRLDQSLMDLQKKVSQGIPIGTDLSFLLAEVVLAEVDRRLGRNTSNAFRWYDDYEFGCDSREDGERVLAELARELGKFRLRLNPTKTGVFQLPLPVDDEWRQSLLASSNRPLDTGREMVDFFDNAFRLRAAHTGAPVLSYALGILFKVRFPSGDAESVALSCITQSLLIEPGVAQKAFTLLNFWRANGMTLDIPTVARTIAKMIARHDAPGPSSDVAWALFFCLESNVRLDKASAKRLSEFRDDAVAVQALDMATKGLLPQGFAKTRLVRELAVVDPHEQHWLAVYECVRQGHTANALLSGDPIYAAMLHRDVPFYRTALPAYASLLHPGGAPWWLVRAMLLAARGESTPQTEFVADSPIVALLQRDVATATTENQTLEDLVARLLGDNYQGGPDEVGDATMYA